MNILKLSLCLLMLALDCLGFAGSTYPMPMRKESNPLDRLDPATEIPRNMDKIRFVVTGKFHGVDMYPTAVPLFSFDDNGYMAQVSEIPVGTEIKLQYVRGYRGRNFYGIEADVKVGESTIKKMNWIDGYNIAISR